MKISNKKFILTSLLIGCSLILLFFVIILTFVFIPFYREYSANQIAIAEQKANLRTLLCEEIKLGMIKEQVLSILEQKGQMSISASNNNMPDSSLDIVYFDPILNEKYGRFKLIFRDYI